MEFYEHLERLRERQPGAVKEILQEGQKRLKGDNPELFDSVTRLVAYDIESSVPIDRTAAILMAAIEAMEPLPFLSDLDFRRQNAERRRNIAGFLNAEEIFLDNRWPGLFEAIQNAAASQSVSLKDMHWLRSAVALVSRTARLKWREERRGREVERKRALLP